MVAVAFALLWSGYSGGLWGWCLLRGYNVTLGQLVSPLHPYGQGKGQGWPPAHMPDTQVFPGPGPGGLRPGRPGGFHRVYGQAVRVDHGLQRAAVLLRAA